MLIVYEGDTLVAVTLEQAKTLNITKAERDKYKELSELLYGEQSTLKGIIVSYEEYVGYLAQEVSATNSLYIGCSDMLDKADKKALKERRGKRAYKSMFIISSGAALTLGVLKILRL
jgi:hypothetical protein